MQKLKWNIKTICILIILLLTALSLTWMASPLYIDYYFSQQPVQTIDQTIPGPTTDTLLGQTVVLDGTIIRTGSFLEDVNKHIIPIKYTDKLNCIPADGSHTTIAGAYNPGSNYSTSNPELEFYAVWVVGGCDV